VRAAAAQRPDFLVGRAIVGFQTRPSRAGLAPSEYWIVRFRLWRTMTVRIHISNSNANVIASEAKQSMEPKEVWIASSLRSSQ
jgi:hypothetical protein